MVSTDRIQVEVRSRGDDDAWTTTIYEPGDDVVLSNVAMSIPIAAFYRGIRF